MMAMKMIDEAHARGGKIKSFTSYCGGLPSPDAANNTLAYKFRYDVAVKSHFLEPTIFLSILMKTVANSYHLCLCSTFQLESSWCYTGRAQSSHVQIRW